MRCALTLAYNGTHFLGSQTQKSSKNTILGVLEHILTQLGIEDKVVASGRTDRGVHATGQVCHVDLPPFWSDEVKLQRVLNEMLPSSIRVKKVAIVAESFHARYGATRRVYRYVIKEGESNPFEADFVTFLPSFDYETLSQNIQLFQGEHDFAYFMKSGSDIKTTTRTIYKAFTYKHKGFVILYFEANGFLRSQIRLMVGALLSRTCHEIQELLACKKKHKVKPAPSNGLYLAKIHYQTHHKGKEC